MKIKELENEIKEDSSQLERLKEEFHKLESNFIERMAKDRFGNLLLENQGVTNETTPRLIEALVSANDEEKIVLGEYLSGINFEGGCGRGLFGYLSSSECPSCLEAKQNVQRLGLEKYLSLRNSADGMEHSLSREAIKKAKETLFGVPLKQERKNIECKVQESANEIFEKQNRLSVFRKLEESGTNYEKVFEKMPGFIELAKELKESEPSYFGRNSRGISYAIADPEENTGVFLTEHWESESGAGCSEYVWVTVFRDGKSETDHFKFRDGFTSKRDRPDLHFKKANIVKITPDGVDLNLESGNNLTTTINYSI
jgi:hypothetical protein